MTRPARMAFRTALPACFLALLAGTAPARTPPPLMPTPGPLEFPPPPIFPPKAAESAPPPKPPPDPPAV